MTTSTTLRILMFTLAACAAAIQPVRGSSTRLRVVIVETAGPQRGMLEPVAERPSLPPPKLGQMCVFLKRHDLRDANGRIISGLSFNAWLEGTGAHVAVFTLVPKPSAPNTFLAGNPGQASSLQLVMLADFGLTLGQPHRLVEFEKAGGESFTVRLDRLSTGQARERVSNRAIAAHEVR
jgi:hypothetical protein